MVWFSLKELLIQKLPFQGIEKGGHPGLQNWLEVSESCTGVLWEASDAYRVGLFKDTN